MSFTTAKEHHANVMVYKRFMAASKVLGEETVSGVQGQGQSANERARAS